MIELGRCVRIFLAHASAVKRNIVYALLALKDIKDALFSSRRTELLDVTAKTVILAKRHLERVQRSASATADPATLVKIGRYTIVVELRVHIWFARSFVTRPTCNVEEASVRRKGETFQSRFCDPRDALILKYLRTEPRDSLVMSQPVTRMWSRVITFIASTYPLLIAILSIYVVSYPQYRCSLTISEVI